MYLVVDCETSGLPTNWRVPYTHVDNWPRAVQIAWSVYDEMHSPVATESHIVQPDGFSIPEQAAKVHGISTARARAEGRPLDDVLGRLYWAADRASVVVAHNANFDGNVLAAEYVRRNFTVPFTPDSMTCTMLGSTDYCGIPGPYGNKWPTLEELYRHLFGTSFFGAHDAGADVAACACCFFELKNRGIIGTS